MYLEMDGRGRKQLKLTLKKAKQKCKQEALHFEVIFFCTSLFFLTFLKFEFQMCTLPRNNYNILDCFLFTTLHILSKPSGFPQHCFSSLFLSIWQNETIYNCSSLPLYLLQIKIFNYIHKHTHTIKNNQHTKKPKQMLKDLTEFYYIGIHLSLENLKCKPASLAIVQNIWAASILSQASE